MDFNIFGIYDGLSIGTYITSSVMRVLIGFILLATVFYAFMLILKLRVLQDTVEISSSSMAKILVSINLIFSIVGSILAFILILL